MEKYITLIKKYNFEFKKDIDFNNFEIIQTGIGDILLAKLCFSNMLFKKNKILFNIAIYVNNPYGLNPLNSFIFKIKLIKKFFNNNEIYFFYSPNISYTNWSQKVKYINNYNLLKPLVKKTYTNNDLEINNKYIIFHTKCRFYKSFNYNNLKHKLKEFFTKFKTNYTIILLGEQNMSKNYESNAHNITTIYNELLLLKNNNTIFDLTIENIYDNLNFDNYINDIALIKNADYNIGVGHGGQYVNSILFGKKSFFFQKPILVNIVDINILKNNNHFSIFDLNKYLDVISNLAYK
tara:strand:- start:164 stop:1042 length:879 start_codon:yes stop_codon:yes gene_type:complete